MKSEAILQTTKRAMAFSYFVGVTVFLATQVAVVMQQGPKVYVSLLWAPVYPVQRFVAESCARGALVFHFSLREATAKGMGLLITSFAFGLVVPALFGLTRHDNRAVRYLGVIALAIAGLLAVVWFPFPNVL
ncbi:MAG TPA: hypothetical protein VE263_16375 [Candidatus Angelobacter sp.]|nr:hypothetical protein [Candidatus Angelobacter sp.]